MKRPLVGAVLAAAAVSFAAVPVPAQGPGQAKPSLVDQKFLKEAATGGVAEVALGKLAASKASSPEVKAFAQHMVDDHGTANDRLKAAVAPQGITLPTEMPAEARKSYE